MNNNQTIKNMELVLLEIRKNVMTKNSETKISKTLIHSYLTLLKDFDRLDIESKKLFSPQLGVQSDQLQIIMSYIKEDKMQELFILNDYVGINNYATVLDKIGQALDSIGQPKRSLYTSMTLIEDLLEKSIQTGTLTVFFDETHRGMGKTTALVKKAHEMDAVLIVGNKTQLEYANDIAKNLGLHPNVITAKKACTLPQYRTQMKEKGYIIDEMVDKEHLRHLKEYKLHGGFIRIVI